MTGRWRVYCEPAITCDDLARMDEEELSDYFMENARFDPRNKSNPYGIFFGQRTIKAADTGKLSQMFSAAVRKYKKGSLSNGQ